jgi:hypothetical protein
MPRRANCEQCDVVFDVKPGTAGKYCSTRCSGIARTTLVKHECDRCGEPFNVKPSKVSWAEQKGRALYCSTNCSADQQRRRPKTAICERCEDEFLTRPDTSNRYCTRECFLGSENNPEARFWARVNRDGPLPKRHSELGNCWDWTGATYTQGYGYFRIGSKQIKAHRFGLLLSGGDLEPDQDALHHCDRRICVRGEHLYAGTNEQNMADVSEAGTRKGEGNNLSKLTEDQVREILSALPLDRGEMTGFALLFGVSVTTIWNIAHRKTWTHLP